MKIDDTNVATIFWISFRQTDDGKACKPEADHTTLSECHSPPPPPPPSSSCLQSLPMRELSPSHLDRAQVRPGVRGRKVTLMLAGSPSTPPLESLLSYPQKRFSCWYMCDWLAVWVCVHRALTSAAVCDFVFKLSGDFFPVIFFLYALTPCSMWWRHAPVRFKKWAVI